MKKIIKLSFIGLLMIIVLTPMNINAKSSIQEDLLAATHKWRVCDGRKEIVDPRYGVFNFRVQYQKNLFNGKTYHNATVDFSQRAYGTIYKVRIEGVSELPNYVLNVSYYVFAEKNTNYGIHLTVPISTGNCSIRIMLSDFEPSRIPDYPNNSL